LNSKSFNRKIRFVFQLMIIKNSHSKIIEI